MPQPRLAERGQLYADRDSSFDSDYSEFVEELAAVGVTGIKQLQALLVSGHESALQSWAADPPVDDDGNPFVYNDVGFARASVGSAMPAFAKYRIVQFFKDDVE